MNTQLTNKYLIEQRQEAVEAILNAGHIPAGMKLFKAEKANLLNNQKYRYYDYKVYSNDKEHYKTGIVIHELDRIITQLNLLGLISFKQLKGDVYLLITDFGMEEVQRLYAYKK